MVAIVAFSLETIRSQFQANTWVDGNQLAPDVLGLSNGGYVVAYNNADINNGFILLDFYSASGESFVRSIPYTIDGADGYSSTDAVGAPSLTELKNGNVVVVWADPNATSPGIRATILSETGEVVRPEFAVTDIPIDAVPQVTALEGGGFVVTYGASFFLGEGPAFHAIVFDEAGNAVTSEFQVNTTSPPWIDAVIGEPAITGLADGGFVVTWTVDGGGFYELRARIFNADGTPRPVNGSADDFVVGGFDQTYGPAVAALPNGNWAVAYTDANWTDEDAGITLTIRGPNGEIVAPAIHVNAPLDPYIELDPDITVLDNGFIVVTWTFPSSSGVDDDIYFRIFDQNGNPITIDGSSGERFLDISLDDAAASAISTIFAGRFVAAWQDTAGDGSGGRVSASIQELVRTTTGDGTAETLTGDSLRDIINGNGGNDTLNGGAGNDMLNGGTGNDYVAGGAGNDIFVVGSAGDITVENAGEGTDTVRSYINWTLAANIERLELQGSGNLNGAGNALANTLVGNSGSNLLNGGGGNDYMVGGAGNDIFIVGAAGDTTIENTGEGTDTVRSYINWTLGADVERLELQGTGNLNGAGNANNNTLVGNSGNNLLNGGGGNDYMVGGAGNDIFVVGAGGDSTIENAGGGSDTIRSYVNWTLGANIERLELQGSGNLNGTGNTLNNTLVGNSGNNSLNGGAGNDYITGGSGNDALNGGDGNDTLIGGAGRDILIGGAGTDTFDFNLVSESPAGAASRDSINGGFSHGADRIDLATIDANSLVAGNQAFSFIGSATFSGVAGQLRYTNYSGNVIIDADVNGDSIADMQILVAGTSFMTGTDFIL
jgi:Ca2+-binding RTX toxin-like protein